jgi:hypothetical protein
MLQADLDALMSRTEQARVLRAMEKTPSGRSAGAPGRFDDYPQVDFTPPPAVRVAALVGLQLRHAGHRGGTDIGVGRAVQLVTAPRIPPRDVKRMAAYFSRHARDLDGLRSGRAPTPGQVAWALWGGWEGKAWADRVVAAMSRKKQR